MAKQEKSLDQIADEAKLTYLTQRNKLLTEAVIAAWLDSHTMEETANILREFADQLENYG